MWSALVMSLPRLDFLEPFILLKTIGFNKVPIFFWSQISFLFKSGLGCLHFQMYQKPFDQEEIFYGLNVVDKIK
jgi:hypothetical protein